MEDLNKLKYKELQKLAKAAGIKANSPKAELVKALEDLNNENEKVDVEKSSVLVDDIDENQQNKLNETFEKENSTLNITFEKNENDCDVTNDSQRTEDQSADANSNLSRFVEFMDDGKEEISFRRTSRRSLEKRTSTPMSSLKSNSKTPRDYLSRKNKTPLRQVVKTPGSVQKKKSDSNIPRFMKFTSKGKSSTRKVPNFAAIHAKNSDKLESLDDYVEKKKKLTDTVTKQLDKARALAAEHNSIVKQVKSKFVPTVTSTAKMNLNFGNMSTSKQEPFKFDSKPVAAAPKVVPKERKDMKTATKVKSEARKPVKSNRGRDNVDAAPKPLFNITNTDKSINMTERSMTKTPGKKFDLKASLAKPLSYEPHKGKIKPLEKKKKAVAPKLGAATQEETKQRQMDVIKGVRLNKRAELLMMRRKVSN